jgi:hypothetical protein
MLAFRAALTRVAISGPFPGKFCLHFATRTIQPSMCTGCLEDITAILQCFHIANDLPVSVVMMKICSALPNLEEML